MGVGLGGTTNPSFYYQPGDPQTDMGNSDWGKAMLEQSPNTAYYRRGQQLGIPDDNTGFGRWFKNQFPNMQLGYQAYTVSNPLTANITDYTNSLGGFAEWYKKYKRESPQVRGEDAASRGGGPARWVGR